MVRRRYTLGVRSASRGALDGRKDPAGPTDVEVTFEPDAAGTRVTLEHRGFEIHGDDGERMRESVGGEGGWPMLLELYARPA